MKNEMVRWMVVDDNEIFLEFAASTLERMTGGGIVRFSSSIDALGAFAAMPEQFPLVITDLEMPEMNGVELCRRIRALSRDANVLLMTGSTSISNEQALEWGFCGLLPKPFSTADLNRAVLCIETTPDAVENFPQLEAASLAA
jgi:CheY-like chemotaxis protein